MTNHERAIAIGFFIVNSDVLMKELNKSMVPPYKKMDDPFKTVNAFKNYKNKVERSINNEQI